MENNSKISRYIIMLLLVVSICFYYIMRLMTMQINDHEEYLAQAQTTNSTTITVPAARGKIVDRYGTVLAENRVTYSIIFDKNHMKKDTENAVIIELFKLLEPDEEWENTLPISFRSTGEPAFASNSENKVKRLKNKLGLQEFATAQNCIDEMTELWGLDGLTSEQMQNVMAVRYGMLEAEFSTVNTYTFAKDVSIETAQKVKESSAVLSGVDIQTSSFREYPNGDIAAHIIGITGPIYAEDLQSLEGKGYSGTDYLGKFGIEKEMEDYLRGTKGKRQIVRDGNGKIIDTIDIVEAEAGSTVVLTIDAQLQKITQESLGKCIRNIAATADGGDNSGIDADAGSAVVIDCRNGEVLASASYPYYDLSEYNEKYDDISKASGNPLFNRALQGAYAPGSTFKPIVALAGLQEGAITEKSTIFCNKTYEKHGITLKCLGTHGSINAHQALTVSCNVFFYETGMRLGISKLNDYCRQVGLGVPTGVGLGESSGVLAGAEQRKVSTGGMWYYADTMTAAIGQNDNKFTPIQLASYMMTIANGGKRYQANLVKTVKSYDFSKTIIEDTAANPVLLNEIHADYAIEQVKSAMKSVVDEGTAKKVLSDYEIEVGGKTGTAIVGLDRDSDNGLFIAFAPYDNPQIAVAIVGEHCAHGSSMVPVAKDIFDYYFKSDKTDGETVLSGTGLIM